MLQDASLPLAAFSAIDWSIVGVYFAAICAVGVVIARREKSAGAGSYFLGGRSLPAWAVSLSLVATMLSTATFVGVPDASFAGDLSYLSLSLGGIIAVFVVAWFFVPPLYAAGTVTIYGFLSQRFGEGARIAVSAAFILGRMLSSGARLFLAAIPLCLLLFGPKFPTAGQLVAAILLISAVGTFYTTLGGVRAVVWVDVIQFGLVVLTAAISIVLLLGRLHMPMSEIISTLAHSASSPNASAATAPSKLHLLDFSIDFAKPYTLLAATFAVSFVNIAAFGTDQDLAQRFLITKSARGGAMSVIASQFIGMVVVSLFLILGLLLYLFYQRAGGAHGAAPAGGHSVYPWFLLNELPTGLAGLALAGFFAVAQGSLDSAMNALASSIVADVWQPLARAWAGARDRRSEEAGAGVGEGAALQDARPKSFKGAHDGEASKWTVALTGLGLSLFAIGCALVYDPGHHTLLDFVQGLMSYAYSGMLGVFATALFTRRGSTWSVIAALVVGAAVVALLQDSVLAEWTKVVFGRQMVLAWPWWMPVASTIAFVVCLLGRRREKPAVEGTLTNT
jgi:Na+/proline symporter